MSDDEDGDWFERAINREDDEDEERLDWDEDVDDVDDAWDEWETGDSPEADAADALEEESPAPEDDAPEDAGDDDLFSEDFGSALGGADVPEGVDDGGTAGTGSEFGMGDGEFDVASDDVGSEFGMGSDDFGMGSDDFGMGGGGDDFGMGSDDFGMGSDEFGMGGGGDDFEEADFETTIPRIDLGIRGLDEMIQGGIPERSLMVTIGSAGTGKTTFGLQFLNEALANGEKAVYITLEESRERVIDSATEKGMPFDEYVENGNLAILDLDPVEMANSLASIRGELPRLIEQFEASRLVLDSVSLLEMMYENRARRRNEIYDFAQSLKAAGITTMLTSEASEDSPYASRHGIVEYLTDAVFVLQYVRPSDFRETRLAVEIQKIRDANHSRETKPYEITNEGLSVYRQANIF